MLNEVKRLKAKIKELEREKQDATLNMRFAVSQKGGVSVYGLQRFPVTLYCNQWFKLLSQCEELKQFIRDNEKLLKTKAESKAA